MLFKEKYIAVFVLKKNSSYTILGRKRFNKSQKVVKFQDKQIKLAIIINNEINTFSEGLKSFFVIDISTEKQLFFEKSKDSGVNAKIVDSILVDEIVKQLTSNLSDYSVFKMNILNIIIGVIIGALTGYIVAGFL